MNTNEIAQLAKTFSTACKQAVEESKAKTYTVPIVQAVLAVLTVSVVAPNGGGEWL